MIKKIIICLLFSIGCVVYAENFIDNDINYKKMSSVDKRQYITQIKKEIFSNDYSKKNNSAEFKNIVKMHLKDSGYPENYYASQSGYTYYKNNYLSCKTTSKFDITYEYSVQEQKNMRIVYYYTMLGNLKNIEIIYGNYPNYPYFSKKYSKRGDVICITYHSSNNVMFTFSQDGVLLNQQY